MKFTHIAAAAVVPAAIAGAAISLGATGHAAARKPAPDKAQHASAPDSARATAARSAPAHGIPAHAQRAQSGAHVWVTVRAGDTLSGIAAGHHMTWQAIYATPPNTSVLHDPNVLLAGERLRIPADPKLRAAQFEARYAGGLRQAAASQGSSSQGSSSQGSSSQGSSSQGSSSQGSASQGSASQSQQAPAQASTAGGGSLTAGMSSFEQCVAWRESSDTPTDPDGLFGLLPSTWQSLGYSGTAGQASVAVQEQAFSRLYAEDGTAPWAPYDGC